MIGDDGIILLAQSFKEAPMLTYVDISLNEIGPSGFQTLCERYEVLPECNISNLIDLQQNKNFLGDDVMACILHQPISLQTQPCLEWKAQEIRFL